MKRGRGTTSRSRTTSTNWGKITGGRDPRTVLSERFQTLYALTEQEQNEEAQLKQDVVDLWLDLTIDLTSHKVTTAALQKAIAKLKLGRGSPDGCTAEVFRALPPSAIASLAVFYTTVLSLLCMPLCWTVVVAILIPKVVGAASLEQFRGISCLCAARKLLGYIWMQMLPTIHYESCQCGFVPRAQAADGVFALKRASELSREWDKGLFVLQLDLSKAFDRVKHSAIIRALKLQGCSLQCLAVLCAMLQNSKTSATLGPFTSDPVDLDRGLPQGAPESPLIFTLVTELILRPLLHTWSRRGSGWRLDAFWLAAICFADDILLVSESRRDLERMFTEVVMAFAEAGLEVSVSKCHFTSYPAKPNSRVALRGDSIAWEQSITFVGCVIDICGNDGAAIAYRQAQATKSFYKWAKVLQSPFASVRRRLSLFVTVVGASALWLAETWHPTKSQRESFQSWGARMCARVIRLRSKPSDEPGQHWRRLHRVGHSLLHRIGGGLNTRRLQRLHSFAGHAARASGGILSQALRTRNLAWWRFHQSRYENRRDGLHPKRFRAWRWEAQLVDVYGETENADTSSNSGWLERAQDRDAWRISCGTFAGVQ